MIFEDRCIYAIDGKNDKYLIATRVKTANALLPRLKGLMFERELPRGHALILYPCSSIHMMFMRFPIDVIYTDRNLNVVRVVRDVKPWTVDFGDKKARYTFELPSGTIDFIPKRIIIEEKIL